MSVAPKGKGGSLLSALSSKLRILFIHLAEQRALEAAAHMLQMHEITIGSTLATPLFELATLGLTEICHWRVLCIDLASCVVAAIQRGEGLLRIIFVVELHVHIAHNMLPNIVTDYHFLDLAILGQLDEHFFKEILKVPDRFLQDLFRNLLP